MPDQSLIWQHFQNAGQDSFAGARPRLDFLIRRIARLAKNTPKVLNIGVGDGYFERCAKSRGWHIQSLDPNEQAISRLRGEGIDAQVGTLEKLPHASESLDVVVVSEVLEHLTDEQRDVGIEEIFRVMKSGGLIIGTVPHAENLIDQQSVCPRCGHLFHRWGHQRSFTLAEMREILSLRFSVKSLGRTAFVSLRRGPRSFLKGVVRVLLAKFGEPIAQATIWWVARK